MKYHKQIVRPFFLAMPARYRFSLLLLLFLIIIIPEISVQGELLAELATMNARTKIEAAIDIITNFLSYVLYGLWTSEVECSRAMGLDYNQKSDNFLSFS